MNPKIHYLLTHTIIRNRRVEGKQALRIEKNVKRIMIYGTKFFGTHRILVIRYESQNVIFLHSHTHLSVTYCEQTTFPFLPSVVNKKKC